MILRKRIRFIWGCVGLASLLFGTWQGSWLAGLFMLAVLAMQAEIALVTVDRDVCSEEETLP